MPHKKPSILSDRIFSPWEWILLLLYFFIKVTDLWQIITITTLFVVGSILAVISSGQRSKSAYCEGLKDGSEVLLKALNEHFEKPTI